MKIFKTISLLCIICMITIVLNQQQPASQLGTPLSDPSDQGYVSDGSMDLTSAKSAQQRQQFIEVSGHVESGTNFIQQLFQSDHDGDDNFAFMLPVDQQVAFHMYAYVAQENTYTRIANVSSEPPVRVWVYEGQNVVVKTSFYFQKYIVFNGKKDIQYKIKFQNSGANKLISISLKLFVESSIINDALSKDHAANYSTQTNSIKYEVMHLINQFGKLWVFDQNNTRQMVKQIRQYYYFELIQILILGVASYVQINLLLKLLKGKSIV